MRPCNYGEVALRRDARMARAREIAPWASQMSDERDKAALAVAHVFRVHDIEWQDHLVELLRDADIEAFRTLLLAEHQRRLDAFTARQEELQRRSHGRPQRLRPGSYRPPKAKATVPKSSLGRLLCGHLSRWLGFGLLRLHHPFKRLVHRVWAFVGTQRARSLHEAAVLLRVVGLIRWFFRGLQS